MVIVKALFFIAWQNLKKKKGDTVVSFLLITLAALLFYTSISVFSGMGSILDMAYDNAHTADVLYMSNVAEEKIEEVMTAQEEVAEYEASDCLYLLDVEYRQEGGTENDQAQFFFGRIEDERKIGKLSGIENLDIDYDSILLPYYMKAAEGVEVGDAFYITLGDKEYKFHVAGFVGDPLFATPLNISVYGTYITSRCMEDMVEDNPAAKSAEYVQHKVRLREGEDCVTFDNKISPILTKEIPELSETTNLGMNWGTMKGGVGMMSQISMGIVLVFSLLLILVVLIVIRFSIRNYIEMNLKNVGILQAAGYTSGQLTISVLFEMGIIAGFAVIAGILLGIAGSGLIGKFEGVMLGISWKQIFHPGAACVTVVVIWGIVLSVSFFSGRIYKKISVLESLRGGIHTHNFKKNYFGFDKSRLPVSLTLVGKNLMCERAKNISIFCIVMLLSFSACVGFGLYENFAVQSDNLLKMVGAEAGNIYISGENMKNVGNEMGKWKEVETVLYYDQGTIQLESKEAETSVVCDIWENPELLQNEMIIRGRLPKYENEIVLTTSIAELLKVETGDTVYVTGQGERIDYLVCGIDQKINNMGLKAMMTQDGAKRLNGNSHVMFLYVYTEEGVTYEDISGKVLDAFPDVSVTDSEKVVAGTMNGVTVAMVAICLLFVMITVLVVVLVEVLLVKSKIIRERRNLGLNKAFGFTTGQLVMQTMMMNLPVIAAGAICGVVLSIYLMEPLIVMCLSFCGIEKCPFTVNFFWMAVTVAGVVAVAAVSSFLSAIKIRKIEPVRMLTEE